jgi:hypothetical protein
MVFERYKECTINKVSYALRTSEKSLQLQIYFVYSTEASSFLNITPKHVDAFVPTWHRCKNFVMLQVASWQVVKLVHQFTAQTKEAVIQFGPLKQLVAGHWFQDHGEVKVALHQWLWIQGPDFCCDGIFKLVPGWEKCISVPGDCAKNNDTSIE